MSIVIRNITKYYGAQKALNEVSFSLEKGEVCGFLGPNGAGKSTLMKIITGCLDGFDGEVLVNGIDIRKKPIEAKRMMGYLPEHNPLYPEMYVREYLTYVARLYRMKNVTKQVDAIIRATGLLPEAGKKIGQLSKGYRQRVGLAQALVHNPELLILDEPMTGLDPNQLEEIRHLITTVGQNKTVLLSTHIMQEVEAICNRVLILDKGSIVADNAKEALRTEANGPLIKIRFAAGTETGWLHKLETIAAVHPVDTNAFLLTPASGTDPRVDLFYAAAANNAPIIELKTEEQQLEALFRKITLH